MKPELKDVSFDDFSFEWHSEFWGQDDHHLFIQLKIQKWWRVKTQNSHYQLISTSLTWRELTIIIQKSVEAYTRVKTTSMQLTNLLQDGFTKLLIVVYLSCCSWKSYWLETSCWTSCELRRVIETSCSTSCWTGFVEKTNRSRSRRRLHFTQHCCDFCW